MISRLALVFLSSVIGFFCLQPTLAGSHHGEGETRYLRFKAEGRVAYGILAGDKVKELGGDLFGSWWKTEVTHNLKDVKILVPSVPSKVMALAGNYQSHIGDAKPPEHPEPFLKTPSSLLRHKGNIVQPNDHAPVHYEAEVVIVIGRRAKNVSKEAALDYVLGITNGNDISARDWQGGETKDVQWWRAKAADTFSPCGPYILSASDYAGLNMKLRVNGEVRQEASTDDMVHGIRETVSFISRYMTLEPGDLIFTGTPGDTKGMNPGDVVTVEIDKVGVLSNTVVKQ